ncbi:MAG: PRC-barrel domain-containing protein [Pseudomonadota bacterium]
MLTRLLATTAIAGLLSTGSAFAEANTKPVFDSDVNITIVEPTDGFYAADSKNQILASNFIGQRIYTNARESGEFVGDVNDIIMSPKGELLGVVVAAGSFLGVGEKDVAISFDSLSYETAPDGQVWLTSSYTEEQLEAAPAFDRSMFGMEADMTADVDTPTTQMTDTDTTVVADNATPAAPAPAAPSMEQDLMIPVTQAEISADTMLGYSVMGIDGDRIGEIDDFILNAEGNIDAVIVDVGGFFGIGEKEVALGFNELQIMRESADAEWSAIQVAATEEQLEELPEWNAETYKTDPNAVVYRPTM